MTSLSPCPRGHPSQPCALAMRPAAKHPALAQLSWPGRRRRPRSHRHGADALYRPEAAALRPLSQPAGDRSRRELFALAYLGGVPHHVLKRWQRRARAGAYGPVREVLAGKLLETRMVLVGETKGAAVKQVVVQRAARRASWPGRATGLRAVRNCRDPRRASSSRV